MLLSRVIAYGDGDIPHVLTFIFHPGGLGYIVSTQQRCMNEDFSCQLLSEN